jgi:4a-hydroxytetrahydrobiopterin dehydratase
MMNAHCDLGDRKCTPCEGGTVALDEAASRQFLRSLSGWTLAGATIEKTFHFRNHHETMAFANAVAWISHRENHHPELTIGYADCRVRYWTHAIGGLSENDFICAAKVERLFTL